MKLLPLFIVISLNCLTVTAQIHVNDTQELLEALESPKAGDTIIIAPGHYKVDERIFINESGTEKQPIVLMAEDLNNRPLLDYSSMPENSSSQGIVLKGDYWHIKGIQITRSGDSGLHLRGSNNLIEYCSFFRCSDTGLQLDDGASHNTILNCDSYYNADKKKENADGFAVKMDVGSYNRFVGCRAWNNLDDGWDGYLREADDIVTSYENCWAFNNGYLENGDKGKGDGNGFKTGGSDNKQRKHHATYIGCIAAGNLYDGFDHNSNRGTVFILNSAAASNGRNIAFSEKQGAEKLVVINTLVIGEPGSVKGEILISSHNSWQLNNPVKGLEIDLQSLAAERNKDGGLPEIKFKNKKELKKLYEGGMDIGLPYKGDLPSIGPLDK